MFFGTFLDREGQWLDTVHFPGIAQQYAFRGKGIYSVFGTVLIEYEALTVEVKYMKKMDIVPDPRYAEITDKNREVITWNKRRDYGSRTTRIE